MAVTEPRVPVEQDGGNGGSHHNIILPNAVLARDVMLLNDLDDFDEERSIRGAEGPATGAGLLARDLLFLFFLL